MADSEHLAILKQGVEDWTRWWTKNPYKRADLSGADLTAANLADATMVEERRVVLLAPSPRLRVPASPPPVSH